MTDEPRHPDRATSRFRAVKRDAPPPTVEPSHAVEKQEPWPKTPADLAQTFSDVGIDPPATADPSPPILDLPPEPEGGDSNRPGPTASRDRGQDNDRPLPPVQGGADGWQPMDTARKDGKPLWLRGPDGETCEAIWRRSRRLVKSPKGADWQEFFCWAVLNAGGQVVPWQPIGWRPQTGAPHP